VPNPDQLDTDGDGQGNACDPDVDLDGFDDAREAYLGTNRLDECADSTAASHPFWNQDAFPPDTNRDKIVNIVDLASITVHQGPVTPANQRYDLDASGTVGNQADYDLVSQNPRWNQPACTNPDGDADTIATTSDNCPTLANTNQLDNEGDNVGDACDTDDDNDSVLDGPDNCDFVWNPDQWDLDQDGQGNACEPDDDNDGVLDGPDNCDYVPNPDQLDTDGDGQGNACDPDVDLDGFDDAREAYLGTLSTDACSNAGEDAFPPDTNRDGRVTIVDLASISVHQGPVTPANKRYDLDGNGTVGNQADYNLVSQNPRWNQAACA